VSQSWSGAKSIVVMWSPLTIRATMLSESDRAVLDFEGSWWLYPGPKDRAIREYLDMSATRYYQVLRRLVEDPEAEAESPMTIRRLRKVREEARRRSVEHRLGGGKP
jgi:hypothetical protein